jgi:hypothetical protein
MQIADSGQAHCLLPVQLVTREGEFGAIGMPEAPILAFYLKVLQALRDADAPFLVGGAHALHHYSGVERDTKDFDIFVRREDYDNTMSILRAVGCNTELTFPHWLGKATSQHALVDVIFSSGNGVSHVDDEWFHYATPGLVFDVPVRICPPEETIWSKAFVAERERYDGADVLHLLLGCAAALDWDRLLRRFGPHWRVLLSYLCLFGFVYPSERGRIPAWVMTALMDLLEREVQAGSTPRRVCQGTLISREQYLPDIELWGFEDARLSMNYAMTETEVAEWTRAITAKK